MKRSPREMYDELLNTWLDLVPVGDDEGEYRLAFRVGRLNPREDLRAGRTVATTS